MIRIPGLLSQCSNVNGCIELQLRYLGATNCDDTIRATSQEVELVIHNGQDGLEVPDHQEELVGAFTVANLNDTDGDGTIDEGDTEVIGTVNGRNEVDLMKLILKKPSPDIGGKVKLSVISGSIKFWEKSTKEAELELSGGEIEINTSDLDKTIWVEATAVSGAIRDIAIELEYNGCKDTVKATGIWAEMTGFRNNGNSLSLNADDVEIGNTFSSDQYNSTLGLITAPPVGARNAMEMEFSLKPSGIGNEPEISFDITRQKEVATWFSVGLSFIELTAGDKAFTPFPLKDEEPNDDGSSTDEDNDPSNDFIYSIDGPGTGSLIASPPRLVCRINFFEFVHVLFDGQAFPGNLNGFVVGSRCSPKVAWRSRMDVMDDGSGKWMRTPLSGENEIELNHKILGGPPSP